MAPYRCSPCVFCGNESAGHCSRCAAPVCSEHRPAYPVWCQRCCSELADEIALARVEVDVKEPPAWLTMPMSAAAVLGHLALRGRLKRKAEREVYRSFLSMSVAEIADLRRAGRT
jgi:hypothetical protein